MHSGADTANALGPDPCLTRIAPPQDQLNPAKHCSRAPGIGDRAAIHFGFNAQVALNASHWIDYDARHTLLLGLFLYFLGPGFSPHAVSNRARNAVDNSSPSNRCCEADADLSRSDVCPKPWHGRETFVKRRFGLPKVVAAAADAAMP